MALLQKIAAAAVLLLATTVALCATVASFLLAADACIGGLLGCTTTYPEDQASWMAHWPEWASRLGGSQPALTAFAGGVLALASMILAIAVFASAKNVVRNVRRH